MLKKIVYLISIVLILGLAVFWYTNYYQDDPLVDVSKEVKNELQAIKDNATATTGEEAASSTAISLLLKSFILSQGEKGHTLWRLTASAGNMSKKGSVFTVETPSLAYNMNDGTELTVVSREGDIDQPNKIMRFIDDVVVLHKDQKLTGELLVYDGNEKTMTFPNPAHFEDSQVSGSAEKVIWFIDTRTIEGIGNINVTFSSPEKLRTR